MIEFVLAEEPAQIDDARTIFREYEKWLGLDLCFQNFEEEMRTLPGKYEPPDGRLILAYKDGVLAGGIALRKIEDGVCEMKRLYLREIARGGGIGSALIEKLIDEARKIGHKKMRLDTFPPKMSKAVKLYESHGFSEIMPYYDNPYDGVIYMEKAL
ncbi:MAG TPA: GNAT family N-acetyltransferase [Pyrinomonadaceae bacterium]|nr:GNAT family N-acetyltransferase [Pyrinomonadaceae bacterium]